MANIPLKSIKFPGLTDTYTIPQIDNTLTQAGEAADAKQAGDALRALDGKTSGLTTIDDYSSLVVGDDWTAALQAAVDANRSVLVPHDIKIYGTVSIPAYHGIVLGAVQVVKPDTADNDDPIFFLGDAGASIAGAGTATRIADNRPSPDGIIKIGAASNTIATKTVIHCSVTDLTVRGAGNEETANMGIHLCGTYGSAPTYFCSYFHILSNLVIHTVAMGIVLNNAANANIITNIEFMRCGHSQTTGAFCFIRTQGEYSVGSIPLENVICNAFHHDSANATTLYFGTAIGLNRISNIICEQGGPNSHIYAIDPDEPVPTNFRNVISYTNNSNANAVTTDEFRQKNTIETQSTYRAATIIANTALTANGNITFNGTEYHSGPTTYIIKDENGLTENTEYLVATFNAQSGTSNLGNAFIRIYASAHNNVGVPLANRCKKAEYWVKYSGTSTPVFAETIEPYGELTCAINENGELRVKMPNNDTGKTNLHVEIVIELLGYVFSNIMTIDEGFVRAN